jgi:hypothetical protein
MLSGSQRFVPVLWIDLPSGSIPVDNRNPWRQITAVAFSVALGVILAAFIL